MAQQSMYKSELRDRFILDPKENILFIDFAGLRIESRERVDEMSRIAREILDRHGRRTYGVVNYEGTEIAPEVIDYYGERIKELYDRYSLTTVRYSSSGFTRSVLRYLGAAKDLESNIFATREEAIRAIQELKGRNRSEAQLSTLRIFNPRYSLLGKLALGWLILLLTLLAAYLGARVWVSPGRLWAVHISAAAAALALLAAALVAGAILFVWVTRPLRQMKELARRLISGGVIEPVEVAGRDDVGQLAQSLNQAARHLQQEIERLSGLYHISLMMGTGTEVSKICELVTGKIARLLDTEMCVILLYDEREGRIQAQLPAYGISDEHARLLGCGVDQNNITTLVFKTGEPYLTNQAATDHLISKPSAVMLGVRTMLAVPLQAARRTLGTLEVMNKRGEFLEEDKRLVTIFASQAAQLLANAQLFEEVRDSEERYRQIFEGALDGLYRSTTEGQLVTLNPALAKMLGYDRPEELVGVNIIRELLTDEAAGASLMEQLARAGQALDVECGLRRKTGEPLPARLSIRVVVDKANNETYHLGIVKDITEQRRLSEQLIISERLAVVGELVAGVAHEVRNPLFGITTTLSALSRRLEYRDEVRPFLDVVMTEVGHLNHLMEQLLEHSRPMRFDTTPLNVRDLINEALGEFGAQAKAKGVSLTCECPEAVPGLRLDRRKIHGVFANLIDNALHHTGPGGKIRIAVDSQNGASGKDVRIEVSDTGAGIAPEDLHKVFEPFFTTRATGTGLGLAIAQKAIHDHGGVITARSEPGEGATFTITLPLEQKENGHGQGKDSHR